MSKKEKKKPPDSRGRAEKGSSSPPRPQLWVHGALPFPKGKGRSRWVVCGLLVLAVGLVFSQTVTQDFVNWDDPQYVYENAHVRRGLSVEGAVWAFTHREASNWHPLTWMSHMLDCQAYGLWAGGHHLTNVLIQSATGLGLFLVLARMTGCLWRSALVAVVFAIHPLRAESVAWIAERKDVLAGLFFVLTLWAYVEYAGRPFSMPRYLLVVACFAMGLMAKPMLVTMPAILLLLDYWPLERLGLEKLPSPFGRGAGGEGGSQSTAAKSGQIGAIAPHRALTEGCLGEGAQRRHAIRAFLEKLPLLAIAGLSSAVTLWAQRETVMSMEHLPLSTRLANVAVAYVGYLGKFFWPSQLSAFYPMPKDGWPMWVVAGACGMLAGISAAAVTVRRSHPYVLVGWLWYLGMMVPVIGIVQVGRQAMADRYTYLPQIGLGIALAWGGANVLVALRGEALPTRRSAMSTLAYVAVGGVLAGLIICAWRQTVYWRNSETLWAHALACTDPDNSAKAHNDLGLALFDAGRVGVALEHYRQALAIEPDYVEALNNLGNAMARLGRPAEAIELYERALRVQPASADLHSNLGNVLTNVGRLSEAIEHCRAAIQIKPDYAEAYYNWGNALFDAGHVVEALDQYDRALQFRPDFAEAHCNTGLCLAKIGRRDEAVEHLAIALRLAEAARQKALVQTLRAQLRQLGADGL